MTKIFEMVDIGVIAKLVPDVKAGLELIKEDGPDRPLRIRAEFHDDVGVPLVRTVHAIMWSRGKSADLPRGFERSFRGTIAGVLRDNLKVKGSLDALGSQVGKVLSNTGMAENHGGQGRGALYWLRPWDTDVEIRWNDRSGLKDRKLDAVVAKQEAKNPPKPVTTSVDLSMIPKPMFATKEAVLEYVSRLVTAHHRLGELYEQSKREVATLKGEVEDMKKDWDIGTELDKIVG